MYRATHPVSETGGETAGPRWYLNKRPIITCNSLSRTMQRTQCVHISTTINGAGLFGREYDKKTWQKCRLFPAEFGETVCEHVLLSVRADGNARSQT